MNTRVARGKKDSQSPFWGRIWYRYAKTHPTLQLFLFCSQGFCSVAGRVSITKDSLSFSGVKEIPVHTLTFWIPLICPFNQQKVKLFAGGSTAPKNNLKCFLFAPLVWAA